MKLLCSILLLLCSSAVAGQTNTFNIGKFNFNFQAPRGWKVAHVNNTLGDDQLSNLAFVMPPQGRTYGTLTLTISEITERERAERDTAEFQRNPKSNINYWYATIDTFAMSAGYAQTPTRYGNGKIHEYYKWYHCALSDSIEISIHFAGQVKHRKESVVDKIVDQFADSFFIMNKQVLLELSYVAHPRAEKVAILDSINFLGGFLKYPELKGWTIDTAQTELSNRIDLLSYRMDKMSVCESAEITVQYFSDNQYTYFKDEVMEKYKGKKYVTFDEEEFRFVSVEIVLDDSLWNRSRDSAFSNREEHFFFLEDESRVVKKESGCGKETEEVIHTLSVFIMHSSRTYTRFDFTIDYFSPDNLKSREIKDDYNRFIYLVLENTDFEQFYLKFR